MFIFTAATTATSTAAKSDSSSSSASSSALMSKALSGFGTGVAGAKKTNPIGAAVLAAAAAEAKQESAVATSSNCRGAVTSAGISSSQKFWPILLLH